MPTEERPQAPDPLLNNRVIEQHCSSSNEATRQQNPRQRDQNPKRRYPLAFGASMSPIVDGGYRSNPCQTSNRHHAESLDQDPRHRANKHQECGTDPRPREDPEKDHRYQYGEPPEQQHLAGISEAQASSLSDNKPIAFNVSRLATRRAITSSARPPSKLRPPHQHQDRRGGFSGAAAGRAGANRLLSAVPVFHEPRFSFGPTDTAQTISAVSIKAPPSNPGSPNKIKSGPIDPALQHSRSPHSIWLLHDKYAYTANTAPAARSTPTPFAPARAVTAAIPIRTSREPKNNSTRAARNAHPVRSKQQPVSHQSASPATKHPAPRDRTTPVRLTPTSCCPELRITSGLLMGIRPGWMDSRWAVGNFYKIAYGW